MRELLSLLLARNTGAQDVVFVTARGVEIPIGRAHDDWTVAEFMRTVAEIDGLAECEERQ